MTYFGLKLISTMECYYFISTMECYYFISTMECYYFIVEIKFRQINCSFSCKIIENIKKTKDIDFFNRMGFFSQIEKKCWDSQEFNEF